MVIIISPAKTFKKTCNKNTQSNNIFEKETHRIIDELKTYDFDRMKSLLKTSDSITSNVISLYQEFENADRYSPIDVFNGQVFKCLDYSSLKENEQHYLDEHLLIISALYGVLRTHDSISEYRLDFDNKMPIDGYKNLTDYWNNKLYEYVKEKSNGVIINLASKEYSEPITKYLENDITLINVDFKVNKGGKYVMQSMSSKSARGYMLRFLAENQIEDVSDIKSFNYDNYTYRDDLSSKQNNIINLVFTKN